MIDYIRYYIAWYAQIAKLLQIYKIELLKPSLKGSRERKSFLINTRFSYSTAEEVALFKTL